MIEDEDESLTTDEGSSFANTTNSHNNTTSRSQRSSGARGFVAPMRAFTAAGAQPRASAADDPYAFDLDQTEPDDEDAGVSGASGDGDEVGSPSTAQKPT